MCVCVCVCVCGVCVCVWGDENRLVSAKCWISATLGPSDAAAERQRMCSSLCVSCSFDPWPHFQRTPLSSLHIHHLASCFTHIDCDECDWRVAALTRQFREISSVLSPCVCRTTRYSSLFYFGSMQCSILCFFFIQSITSVELNSTIN